MGVIRTFQVAVFIYTDPVFTFLRAGTLVTVDTDLAANTVNAGGTFLALLAFFTAVPVSRLPGDSIFIGTAAT